MRGALGRRAKHWIVNRGWRGFSAEVWRRARLIVSGKPTPGERTPVIRQHPFDTRNGVETGGLIFGEQLDVKQPAAYWATAYYGIAPSVLTAALDRLALDWTRFTFVDVGCGKGRALMIALHYPFRSIFGVELSPALAQVARQNVEISRVAVPVSIICGDASAVTLPDGPLVILLYHPFAAPVMRRFLRQLAAVASEPREIFLIYANPELHPMVRSVPQLEVVCDECLPMSDEDRAADRFGSEWERIVLYRSLAA